MIIIDTTTVVFKMPEEYKRALEFGEEHKDWIRSEDTMFTVFKIEKTYSVKLKEDGEA